MDTLDVKAVKAESYHETGSVVNVATLTSGRIVVEKGAYIKEVDTTNATSGSSLVVDGYVNTVTAAAGEGAVVATGTGYVADNNGTELGSAENVSTSIKSLADLHLFRDRVNIGAWDAHLSAKLDADLDLTGVVWTPIGNSLHPFAGTFNGQGHVVKGLTNAGYESDDNNATFTTSTSMATGYAYGLFGIVGSTTDNAAAVTLKNVSFEEVNINCQNSNMLGALVGADVKAAKVGNATINADYAGNIMIDSVKVAGSIKALDSVGGIAGKLYTLGRVTLNGCENSASVSNNVPTNPWTTTDSNYKVSGLLGYRGYSVITVTNCTNSGSVFKAGTKGFGSAIANVGLDDISGDNFIRSGNANTGTVTWQQSDGTLDLVSRNYFFNYRISAGGLSND